MARVNNDGSRILTFIDKMASKWLNFRTDQNVKWLKKQNPEAFGKFLKADATPDRTSFLTQAPELMFLASQAAALLQANNAKNYVEIEMFPRLDHGTRPIRVTIQWALGAESPAQKAARLEQEVERLKLEQAKQNEAQATGTNE